MHLRAVVLFLLLSLGLVGIPRPASAFLQFDGNPGNYVEIPDPGTETPDFSVGPKGLTVSAWIRPDTLCFSNTDGKGYVHWMGKGCRWVNALGRCCQINPQGLCVEPGSQPQFEWTMRMYSQDNGEGRDNRTSIYVFNLEGGEGIGSFFQETLEPGEWIHVVGVIEPVDAAGSGRVRIYQNGIFRKCDQYTGVSDPDGFCQRVPPPPPPRDISPMQGPAPLRIGHRDRLSFFRGGIARVRIWKRVLQGTEVADLYFRGVIPRDDLVAEYLFNEGTGTMVHDMAGTHDGTIIGTVTWGTDPEPGP